MLLLKATLIVTLLAFSHGASAVHDREKRPGLRSGDNSKTASTDNKIITNCFSGENLVEVQNKGAVFTKDRSADGHMDRVYGFGPFQPSIKAEFLQIHTSGAAKRITCYLLVATPLRPPKFKWETSSIYPIDKER
jgi:hypothetical protein